jgi:hypothetical protein
MLPTLSILAASTLTPVLKINLPALFDVAKIKFLFGKSHLKNAAKLSAGFAKYNCELLLSGANNPILGEVLD